MIKRTIFFGNPVYLRTEQQQMVVDYKDSKKKAARLPIEDIGIIVLEHPQITLTHGLMQRLTAQKVVLITCDQRHMPCGLMLAVEGHSEQSQRLQIQVEVSKPLKKQLWQQTVRTKIRNQGLVLERLGKDGRTLEYWSKQVQSGDAKNHEAFAAAHYWQHLFGIDEFQRDRDGLPPNNLLNYGYAILRAIAARSLVATGLHPGLGIFHKNKYNAYCLADDIMEPYRPMVDRLVTELVDEIGYNFILDTGIKRQLLQIPMMDVLIDGKRSPLMNAMLRTCHSLYRCYEGKKRKILYPSLYD
ncbi:type II CRISPR-associated endonuclease Cas1 [Membranihabitans marinus]|uniref:type II CRISPR-associated endonuclease Cas1 n=1 Tax=Membranihabitans marinus TaxID=1227546 RepID=UPI001F01DE02|nr:type II CRISPR-associated endonuclease Cas1 [Membranihabitans marinus]